MNNSKKLLAIVAALTVAASAITLIAGTAQTASAAITIVCENPSGNEPQGNCQGEALDEFAENPAGNRPPGQQPDEE